jgi:transcriptional regulator with AAA-type ATPase domain
MNKLENQTVEYFRQQTLAMLDSPNIRIGVDAGHITERFHMHRTDASRLSMTLFREGILIKINKKPVRYLHRDTLENVLQQSHLPEELPVVELLRMLQAPASKRISQVFEDYFDLRCFPKSIINDAKAAITYPPAGLHTLISGPTGSGKTFLADIMYQYGLEIGKYRKDTPFIRFNCSDYANNPQLLLSQLFGHNAGAYTDARIEKKGLVEHAKDGILFLDEVHSLPPQGQEMLFSIIDKGLYRRMGETHVERTVKLLLIIATSHDPREVLISTLRRRIPVTIEMPALCQRQPRERLKIIQSTFQNECNIINKKIMVSRMVVSILMTYECPGNIGQLKADIKNVCSRVYLNCNQPLLRVELTHLPDYMLFDTIDGTRTDSELNLIKSDLYFSPADAKQTPGANLPNLFELLGKEHGTAPMNRADIVMLTYNYLQHVEYLEYNASFTKGPDFYALEKACWVMESARILTPSIMPALCHTLVSLRSGAQLNTLLLEALHGFCGDSVYYKRIADAADCLADTLKDKEQLDTLCLLVSWFFCVLSEKEKVQNSIYLVSENEVEVQRIADTTNKLLGISSLRALSLPQTENDVSMGNDFLVIQIGAARRIIAQHFRKQLGAEPNVIFNSITTTNTVLTANRIIQSEWDFEKIRDSVELIQPASTIDKAVKQFSLIVLLVDKKEFCGERVYQILRSILRLNGVSGVVPHLIGLNQCGSYTAMQKAIDDIGSKDGSLCCIVDMIGIVANGVEAIPFEMLVQQKYAIQLLSQLAKNNFAFSEKMEMVPPLDVFEDKDILNGLLRCVSFIDVYKVRDVLRKTLQEPDIASLGFSAHEKLRLYVYATLLTERVISSRFLTYDMPPQAGEQPMYLIEKLCSRLGQFFGIRIPDGEQRWLARQVFRGARAAG